MAEYNIVVVGKIRTGKTRIVRNLVLEDVGNIKKRKRSTTKNETFIFKNSSGIKYNITDTVGIDYPSMNKDLKNLDETLENCDIVIIVHDLETGIEKLDKKLIEYIKSKSKITMNVCNKYDESDEDIIDIVNDTKENIKNNDMLLIPSNFSDSYDKEIHLKLYEMINKTIDENINLINGEKINKLISATKNKTIVDIVKMYSKIIEMGIKSEKYNLEYYIKRAFNDVSIKFDDTEHKTIEEDEKIETDDESDDEESGDEDDNKDEDSEVNDDDDDDDDDDEHDESSMDELNKYKNIKTVWNELEENGLTKYVIVKYLNEKCIINDERQIELNIESMEEDFDTSAEMLVTELLNKVKKLFLTKEINIYDLSGDTFNSLNVSDNLVKIAEMVYKFRKNKEIVDLATQVFDVIFYVVGCRLFSAIENTKSLSKNEELTGTFFTLYTIGKSNKYKYTSLLSGLMLHTPTQKREINGAILNMIDNGYYMSNIFSECYNLLNETKDEEEKKKFFEPEETFNFENLLMKHNC
jgi:small GTP-binding protein